MNRSTDDKAITVYLKAINEATTFVDITKAEIALYGIRYGYIGVNEPLCNHIKYSSNKDSFVHPWSGKIIGEKFAFNNFQEFVSITDYLKQYPEFDSILEGMALGTRKRKEEEERAKAAANKGKSEAELAMEEVKKSLNKQRN